MNSQLISNKSNKISFNSLKNLKNNSITIIKVEKDDNKTLSGTIKIEKNSRENIINKSKIKSLSKIINAKQKSVSPIYNKNKKNHHGNIITKYIQRDSRKKK